MLTRFLRSFIIVALVLIILCSFLVVNPSSRAFVDPFTGKLFGEGGFEPHIGDVELDKEALHGGVIMGKMGNETAKCVLLFSLYDV